MVLSVEVFNKEDNVQAKYLVVTSRDAAWTDDHEEAIGWLRSDLLALKGEGKDAL